MKLTVLLRHAHIIRCVSVGEATSAADQAGIRLLLIFRGELMLATQYAVLLSLSCSFGYKTNQKSKDCSNLGRRSIEEEGSKNCIGTVERL